MSTVDVKQTSNRKPAVKGRDAEQSRSAGAPLAPALWPVSGLEVAFSADKPSLITSPEGAKARLPEPPRKPDPARGRGRPGPRRFVRPAARLS